VSLPTDITSEQLWAEITSAPRPHRLVPFPRKRAGSDEPICDVAMCVLTQAEVVAAAAAAERETRRLLRDDPKKGSERPELYATSKGASDLHNNCASVEILSRSARMANDITKPFFRAREDITRHLTVDEVGVMMGEYLMVQADLGPVIHDLSEEEVDAWIEKLTTGGKKFLLPFLSWGAVSTLITSLARRALSSPTANSSPTSQPDDGSQSSETEMEMETTESSPYGEAI
jgi:hypothetical protein